MKRFQRTIVAVMAATISTAGLAAVATPASAEVVGHVTVNPTTGNDETLFGGSATTDCPADTVDSYWTIDGADLPRDQAFIGFGNSTGDGSQSFSGASIANVKSSNAGSFSASGPYQIRFNCVNPSGSVTDTYEATLNYTAGGAGAWTISETPLAPRDTATTLTSDAAGPVEQGTTVTFTADVTPTTGADDPTGSVEFFNNGSTSLGVDNTLTPTGGAELATAELPVGDNSVTAVFTPADSTLNGSTSSPVVVTVTAVAPRSTTSALTVDPVSGPAYQPVTLTCAVTASSGAANGTAKFLDGTTQVGSAAVRDGAPGVFTSSAFGPGAHDFVCEFVGTAPYQNSTSKRVAATYTQVGADPDEQTVTVDIPQGAITITTPYTPAAPLHLGTAVLDSANSTYSASATFKDIVITDSRAGNLGWTASVVAGAFSNGTSTFDGDRAGLYHLKAYQVAGNALQASDVVVTDWRAADPGIGVPREFATYPADKPTGTAHINGTFGVDEVPSSVTPGTYTSTVVFTAV